MSMLRTTVSKMLLKSEAVEDCRQNWADIEALTKAILKTASLSILKWASF